MSDVLSNLPNNVEQLKALLRDQRRQCEGLTREREELTREREELTRQLAEHAETRASQSALIDTQAGTILEYQLKIAGLEKQIEKLLRRTYGPQKERINPAQLTLFSKDDIQKLAEELSSGVEDSVPPDDGAEDVSTPDETAGGKKSKRRKGHGRRRLSECVPDHIPVETQVHDLPESQWPCPCCGELRCEIGREVSQQLEFVPASLKVIEHQRVKRACRQCAEHVAIGSKPPQPIEKGLPGPGLLAHTVLLKYGDYLPLYRQEDMLSRHGVIIRRSTLCDWVASSADLLKPLYNLICQRVRASHVIHTDDTGIKKLAPGKCDNCKFWAYAGDASHPYAAYEFSETREGVNPQTFLSGFKGYLQADAFVGYDGVYAGGNVKEVACMAHCRRYWWEAMENDSRAHRALSFIARLYALEEQFTKKKFTGDGLRDARQKLSIPILDQFKVWLDSEQSQVLPKSGIGKAFTYTLNQWKALCRYTEDGALNIDNNLAERLMKLPAIGRKNWLFVGSEAGGERAAILLSVIASAKLCHVEPWAWLNALFEEIPRRTSGRGEDDPPPDLSDLLPDKWLSSHPEHRWAIDDIRQEERRRSRQQKIKKRQPDR